MRRTTLLILAGLLASCAPHATPDPESAPPRLIGYLQVNTDPAHPDARWVNPVALTPLTLTETPGVQFRSVTTAPAAVNDTARGERFFSTTLQVSAPERRNIYLIGVDTAQTIGDTAFTSVRSDAGVLLGESAARSVKPAHRMTAPGVVHPAAADLVVFSEADLADRTSMAPALFPWGFAARVCQTSACDTYTRTFPPDPGGQTTYSGRVTLAFRVPLNGTATPRSVTGTYAVFAESGEDLRVTQTPEEQARGTVAGLGAPNAQALPPAFRVIHFPGSTIPFGTRLTTVRTSGPAGAPTSTLFPPADPCAAPSGVLDPCFTPVITRPILSDLHLQTSGADTLVFGTQSGSGLAWESLSAPSASALLSLPPTAHRPLLHAGRVTTGAVDVDGGTGFRIARYLVSGQPDPTFTPPGIPYDLALSTGNLPGEPPVLVQLGTDLLVISAYQREELICGENGCGWSMTPEEGLRTTVLTSGGAVNAAHPLHDRRQTLVGARDATLGPSCANATAAAVVAPGPTSGTSRLVTFSAQGATARQLNSGPVLACRLRANGDVHLITGGSAPQFLTVTSGSVTDVPLLVGVLPGGGVRKAAFYADGHAYLGTYRSAAPPATVECTPTGTCGDLRPVGLLESSIEDVAIDASGQPLTLRADGMFDGGPPQLTLERWIR